MIKKLSNSDKEEIIELLSQHNLPISDINLEIQHFLGYFESDRLIGIGAVEVHGSYALLRSMAIKPDKLGKGIGTKLLAELIDLSLKMHVSTIYLLTETAESFFSKHDFEVLQRELVPIEIQKTS